MGQSGGDGLKEENNKKKVEAGDEVKHKEGVKSVKIRRGDYDKGGYGECYSMQTLCWVTVTKQSPILGQQIFNKWGYATRFQATTP